MRKSSQAIPAYFAAAPSPKSRRTKERLLAIQIETSIEAGNVAIKLAGELDTAAAPELEAALDNALPEAKTLVFDLSGLEYIASSGLRLILRAQKLMKTQGSMKLVNVGASVQEVFDITGFTDFLTIE